MLAASRVGITSRLAAPFSLEFGKIRLRMPASMAASPCISPSTSMSGASSCRRARAARILSAEGLSAVPKLECDSSATFGWIPKRRTSARSEEHTSELQSLMRISYAVFCLKKKITHPCELHPYHDPTKHHNTHSPPR